MFLNVPPVTVTPTFIKSESILCFIMYRMLLFLATLFIIVGEVFIIGEVFVIGEVYSIVGEVLIVVGEVCIIGEVYSIVSEFIIVGLQNII